MKEKHLLLLLVLSLISFSCKKEYSKSVNQNNIAQSIYIIYDEYFDTTSATISFHQNNANGNELFLSGGASVTINGQTPIPTIYPVYNVKWKGVVDSVTFVYTDTHGDIYTNTIFLHTADFPIGFNDTIDSNIDVVLNWVGNPNSILGQSTSLQVQEDIEIALCGGPNGNYCTYGGRGYNCNNFLYCSWNIQCGHDKKSLVLGSSSINKCRRSVSKLV